MARISSFLTAAALALAVTACAEIPSDPEERAEAEAINDPLEPANRAIFSMNMYLDQNLLEPIAQAYRDDMPEWLRNGVHNFLVNLQEPYVAGNDLLQGNPQGAADSLGRFMVNSTFGLLGTNDAVAETGGAKPHSTDLGVTLGVWGVEEGPYLMVPLFGPSNLRDGSARVAEFWLEPTGAVLGAQGLGAVSAARLGTGALDTRANRIDAMNDIRRNSIDQYATLRSLFQQTRKASVLKARGVQESDGPLPQETSGTPMPATGPMSSEAKNTEDKGRPQAVEFVEPK
ncbi:putative Surface lipoprotein [Magnetospirillum sp. XM-1]|uniref:MlaA family lipoprotein n=1 Tax=Magnetospirillum sp. XM-1 TaxID=1663591 RepID=UPI00073DEC24|nr:VacJ family lipoprotein [Magnetospirillum sp. XM-1]CUW39618.1 putative Surface lipoprotein [Magnetospirillum sp. XM-1]